MFAYLVLLNKDPKDQKLKIEVPKEKLCLIRATFKNKKLSTRVSDDCCKIGYWSLNKN